MKHIIKLFPFFIFILLFIQCGLDNYDPPTSQLSGQIEYNGQPVRLKGTYGAIQLQMYQDGYEFKNPMSVFVDQDGKFEATLFDGEYKLVTRDNNGPWVNTRDTTIIKVSGNTAMKLEVTPFFTISNANINLNGNQFTGSATVNQVVNTAKLAFVRLYINGTSFVDENISLFWIPSNVLQPGNVSFNFDLAALNDDQKRALNKLKGVYARIGVKTEGTDQAIYSEVFKLK